jgi:hypothetical protein
MSTQRRKFTSEFKAEAIALVRRTGPERQPDCQGIGSQPDRIEPLAATVRYPRTQDEWVSGRRGSASSATRSGTVTDGARHPKKGGRLLRQRVSMRYSFIHAEKAQYPVAVLCRVMDVARSGFYAWCQRPFSPRAQQNQSLLAQIQRAHRDSDGSYGSPRIHRDLRSQGLRISRHRVARLMRVHGIRGVCRRRSVWRARPTAPAVAAANVLQRDFVATRPNQKWAGDLTYIATGEGWLYVAVLVDLYSRRVVGWGHGRASHDGADSHGADHGLAAATGPGYLAAPFRSREPRRIQPVVATPLFIGGVYGTTDWA